jgi:hypothetical protein
MPANVKEAWNNFKSGTYTSQEALNNILLLIQSWWKEARV